MTSPSPRRGRGAEALALAAALALTVAVGVAPDTAAGQAPSHLRWSALPSDASARAWMDSTHITVGAAKRVDAWYKTEAAHETISTVVHYAIDCPGFRLSVRRLITYDRDRVVLSDATRHGGFFYPPPIRSLQDFMYIACRRAP